jgi:TolB-like protein/Tfp pilus assembly protein PilF
MRRSQVLKGSFRISEILLNSAGDRLLPERWTMTHTYGEKQFTFGSLTLDLMRGTLQNIDGIEIKLRPKSFQLLSYFVLNPGRLISKDELTNFLWPNVIVGDDSLAQCVSELRTAIGDFDRRIVKTMARRGYLFTVLPESVKAAEQRPTPGAGSHGSRLTLPDKPSLAVLPFTNLSGDPDQEYFADGMVEEIITALSSIRWLFVIARNSTFSYKGRAVDIREVGRELGVRYVLEGSVRRSGNHVRINGQLIDTTNGAHIWAEKFDGALDNIFELQDRVAANVAGVIEPRLRLSEIERANRKPTQHLNAYDLYLQALGHFHKFKKDDINKAANLAKQALTIDPAYAPAAALISECYMVRQAHGGDRVSDDEREESIRLARHAIDLGKEDPEALWMAAISLSFFSAEHGRAAAAVERALILNPNSAHAWNASGFIQLYQNKPHAAIEAFERAIRLSPLDPVMGYFQAGLAQSNLILGRYEDALEWADQSLRRLPDYIAALRTKVISCVQLQRIAEARELTEHLLKRRPDITIARWKHTVLRDLPADILETHLDSLRLAGVPER